MNRLDSYRVSRPQDVHEEPWRTPYERDADRILYASAFSRLRDVTQVLRPGTAPLAHDRLLHSLKVAQVGYRLAQFLRYQALTNKVALPHPVEPDVVYSAGLAHDLGHPPFGHIGEAELQEVLAHPQPAGQNLVSRPSLVDSFEGNAQTFRIVTRLSFRSKSHGQPASGLNLTWATLAAVLKYPWCKGGNRLPSDGNKWGAYDIDRGYLDGALAAIPSGWERSVEASIMDWADDVTYAVHDVEDFIRAGLIPIHELIMSNDEKRDFAAYCASSNREGLHAASTKELLRALKNIMAGGLGRSYRGGKLDKQVMHAWASSRIDFFSNSCSINAEDGTLTIPPQVRLENSIMKQLVWFYVVDHPTLSSEHRGQRRLLRELLEAVFSWSTDLLGSQRDLERPHRSSLRKYPSRLVDFAALSLREIDGHTDIYPDSVSRLLRAVTDYIVSLSDSEAVELHGRLISAS